MKDTMGASQTLAQGNLGCWDHPDRAEESQGEEGGSTEVSPLYPHQLERTLLKCFF